MIKKIIFLCLLSFLISSCGKKGDPVYKDSEQKTNLQITPKNKS